MQKWNVHLGKQTRRDKTFEQLFTGNGPWREIKVCECAHSSARCWGFTVDASSHRCDLDALRLEVENSTFGWFADVPDKFCSSCPRTWPPLPFFDRRELAGYESDWRRPVTFIFSRLNDPSDKGETSCPQWRGLHQSVFALPCCYGEKVEYWGTDICGTSSSTPHCPRCTTPTVAKLALVISVLVGYFKSQLHLFGSFCRPMGLLCKQGKTLGGGEGRGKQSFHSHFALPHRHTVSEVSEEMKSLIIEKNKMGLEEESEVLVKGESYSLKKHNKIHPYPPYTV